MTERSQSGTTVTFEPFTTIIRRKTAHSDVHLVNTPDHGRVLLMDNEIQFAEADEHRYHEMLIHPAMASVEKRFRVAILGGGDGLAAREVLKWEDVRHIDIIDYDQEFVEQIATSCLHDMNAGVYQNPKVMHRPVNALTFARNTDVDPYDVIVIDLPDPEGPFIQLYHDLLYACERILDPKGVIALHIGPVSLHEQHSFWKFFLELMDTSSHVYGRTHRGHMRSAHIPSFMNPWGFFYIVPRNSRVANEAYTISYQCRFWNPTRVEHKLLSSRPYYVGDKDIQRITDALYASSCDDVHP